MRGPPACPPPLAGLPPPLPAGLPGSHLPRHPVSPPKPPHPKCGELHPIGLGSSARQPRHRLLIPGRISVICAFITSQRVKGQMEPGLGAVPATLRTLRQHIANVPQVGPRAAVPTLALGAAQGWLRSPRGVVWEERGGDAAALKMYFEWQRGASSPPGGCCPRPTGSSLLAGGADGGRPVQGASTADNFRPGR